MDAVLEIILSKPMPADDIQHVVVKTHRFASDLGEKNPQAVSAKKSSIPYCVALAIMKKRVFLDEFQLTPAEEETILKLAQKVEVQLDPDMDRIHVADEGRRPSLVEVYLKNGSVLSAQKEVAKGWPENPFSEEELEQKFFQLVNEDLAKDRATDILQMVMELDGLADISKLVKQIVCIEF
jgi:2-methylcitrate dehydratase PrpD